MNKKQFQEKFLNKRWFAYVEDPEDAVITNKLSEVYGMVCDGTKEEFVEEVLNWCYDSRSKTFNADIDGPTFTASDSKKELLERLRKGGVHI